MNLDQAIQELRALARPVPRALRLPTIQEIESLEQSLSVRFHADYRQYLLQASDVTFGTLEPGTITNPQSHTYLPEVVQSARTSGVPVELFPICEDNGNFYCATSSGTVRYWAHDGDTDECWPSLAAWIEEVWLGMRV